MVGRMLLLLSSCGLFISGCIVHPGSVEVTRRRSWSRQSRWNRRRPRGTAHPATPKKAGVSAGARRPGTREGFVAHGAQAVVPGQVPCLWRACFDHCIATSYKP